MGCWWVGLAAAAVVGATAAGGTGLARADMEPNDGLYQAEGPVAALVEGALSTSNDRDWYVFHAAGQQQLRVTATRTGPAVGCFAVDRELVVTLRDDQGGEIAHLWFNDDAQRSITHSTAPGVSRYFVEVSSDCETQPYRIDIAPPAGLAAMPGMPVAVPLDPQPDGSAAGAGPLAGGTAYRAMLAGPLDVDRFWFTADAPFTVEFTGVSGCEVDAQLGDVKGLELGSASVQVDRVSRLTAAPKRPTRYLLTITDGEVFGCDSEAGYQFRLLPPRAIDPAAVAVSAPAAPRRLRADVVARHRIGVRWPRTASADSYRVRIAPKPRRGLRSVTTSQTGAMFTGLTAGRSHRICVRASNAAGRSPALCRILRTQATGRDART